MGWFILIMIIGGIVGAIYLGIKQADENAAEALRIDKSIREDFDIDELYISPTNHAFIGINFDQQTLALGDASFRKEFLFSEVASVDVIRNGASVSSTNRGSQLLGAAVGGIALGGIGLLAGALSGSTRTIDRTNEIGLKIVVDDRVKPVHYIQMFKWADTKGLDSGHPVIKSVAEFAEKWNAYVVNGMRKAAQAHEGHLRLTEAPNSSAPMTSSYADQVKQLWDLHQAGALSAEEFQQQKALMTAMPQRTD